MTKVERISVVIPVFNGALTLSRTLATIRQQMDRNLELIVVDDGSTEDLSGVVREAGATYHRLNENSGPATARTEGARIASGEIILFTDSDVWLPERLIEKLRKTFTEKGCECVQGTFSRQTPHPNFFSQYKNLYNRFVINQLGDYITTTYTSLTAVKRDFFLQSTGFDLNIRGASVEDRTLGESLIRAGGKIYLDRELEVIHNKYIDFKGFLRNQFYRSRDLAKLMLRQRESGFIKKTGSFGTNSRTSMMRLPLVLGLIILLLVAPWQPFLWWGVLVVLGLHLGLIGNWLKYLKDEKGYWFALRGWGADLVDAVASLAGVLTGFYEYKVLKKRY